MGAEEWSRGEGSSEGKPGDAAKMICKTERVVAILVWRLECKE